MTAFMRFFSYGIAKLQHDGQQQAQSIHLQHVHGGHIDTSTAESRTGDPRSPGSILCTGTLESVLVDLEPVRFTAHKTVGEEHTAEQRHLLMMRQLGQEWELALPAAMSASACRAAGESSAGAGRRARILPMTFST
jgi:hypothetical protein